MQRSHFKKEERWGFTADSYHRDAFFYECLDLRKLFFSGALIFVLRGTIAQVVVAVALSYVFILLHIRIWPT